VAAGAGSHRFKSRFWLSASSLMARLGQQFLVFVLAHLLAALFDHTAQ
jgi:hypothetical protein